jgi:5-methylcytosine-specific restriction protein A
MFPLELAAPNYKPTISIFDIKNVQRIRQRALRKYSIDQLRKRASAASAKPPRRLAEVDQIIRNEDVAAYAKKAASGKCDLCQGGAPFRGKNNEPFLECHHVKHLAKGGPDTIENAVALCPNCHRRMHVLDLSRDRNRLGVRIQQREEAFANDEGKIGQVR